MKLQTPLIAGAIGLALFSTAQADERVNPFKYDGPDQTVVINSISFVVEGNYQFFTWQTLPEDVKYERQPIVSFTNPQGNTHYYEVVYLPSGNLNWFQSAKLAEEAGGYLASITSAEENAFLFELVNDEKYFWKFPKHIEGSREPDHYEIKIGPFLGGYQPEGSEEPLGDWSWLCGEKWEYSNWAQDLNDGVIDQDPRDGTQPNDSGWGQRVMGFGEMNKPVPTWGDYMDGVGNYGVDKSPGKSYGFIIEYNNNPEKS
ncbi:C-type lectin-like domain-containing protein [Vibrio algarum]|uniref:C-type lectin domain-containing protein n=1 Tax=Vibrio algarum TaxID=3020714 RepID=A0ABT4YRT6_9VIBR|nr:hypothetical protein [Vibrio sp. KJ40-1]MDB1124269.1 hypothetical protein [Vibrio sp. KJ40-1]